MRSFPDPEKSVTCNAIHNLTKRHSRIMPVLFRLPLCASHSRWLKNQRRLTLPTWAWAPVVLICLQLVERRSGAHAAAHHTNGPRARCVWFKFTSACHCSKKYSPRATATFVCFGAHLARLTTHGKEPPPLAAASLCGTSSHGRAVPPGCLLSESLS